MTSTTLPPYPAPLDLLGVLNSGREQDRVQNRLAIGRDDSIAYRFRKAWRNGKRVVVMDQVWIPSWRLCGQRRYGSTEQCQDRNGESGELQGLALWLDPHTDGVGCDGVDPANPTDHDALEVYGDERSAQGQGERH